MTTKKLSESEQQLNDHLSHQKHLDENNLQPQHKTIIRKNGSRRVSLDVSGLSKTDQSFKKATDINNILKQYATQQIAPQPVTNPLFFKDNTNIPSLSEAFEVSNRLRESFLNIPADIRKLCDNDPAKLPSLLSDPNYRDLLIKRGVLTAPPKIPKTVEVPANQKPGDLANSSKTEVKSSKKGADE